MVCLFFLSSKVLLESAFHQLMENGENQTKSSPKHIKLKKQKHMIDSHLN